MKEITQVDRDQYLRICAYGSPGSGRTYFYATFPRPWFVHPSIEFGWNTTLSMNPSLFYDGTTPRITAVDGIKDMVDVSKQIEAEVTKDPLKYQTIVFDSLHVYIDMLVRELSTTIKDKRQLWGTAQDNVGFVLDRVLKLPVNVVITSHRSWDEERKEGSPMFPGKLGEKLSGLFNYIFYHDVDRKIYTKRKDNWAARCRKPLPNPLVGTYKDLEKVFKGIDK